MRRLGSLKDVVAAFEGSVRAGRSRSRTTRRNGCSPCWRISAVVKAQGDDEMPDGLFELRDALIDPNDCCTKPAGKSVSSI